MGVDGDGRGCGCGGDGGDDDDEGSGSSPRGCFPRQDFVGKVVVVVVVVEVVGSLAWPWLCWGSPVGRLLLLLLLLLLFPFATAWP